VCVEAKESKIDPGRAHIHKYLRLDIGGERPRERKMRFEHADSNIAATVLFRFRKEASRVGFCVMWGGEKEEREGPAQRPGYYCA